VSRLNRPSIGIARKEYHRTIKPLVNILSAFSARQKENNLHFHFPSR
jgi:hypothetical protein